MRDTQLFEALWRRGSAEDLRALRTLMELCPEHALPAFLRGPEGAVFCVAPDAREAEQVARLLEGQYWTSEFPLALMARAQLGSSAWLVARDGIHGPVLASARAISDGARLAFVMDVIVRPDLRGCGLGVALMRLLLHHPALRDVLCIRLRTRDAHGLYARFGFAPVEGHATEMELRRGVNEV